MRSVAGSDAPMHLPRSHTGLSDHELNFGGSQGISHYFFCNHIGKEIRGYFNMLDFFDYVNVFSWQSFIFKFIRLLSYKMHRSLITKML